MCFVCILHALQSSYHCGSLRLFERRVLDEDVSPRNPNFREGNSNACVSLIIDRPLRVCCVEKGASHHSSRNHAGLCHPHDCTFRAVAHPDSPTSINSDSQDPVGTGCCANANVVGPDAHHHDDSPSKPRALPPCFWSFPHPSHACDHDGLETHTSPVLHQPMHASPHYSSEPGLKSRNAFLTPPSCAAHHEPEPGRLRHARPGAGRSHSRHWTSPDRDPRRRGTCRHVHSAHCNSRS